jgi:general secretion pathway protein M
MTPTIRSWWAGRTLREQRLLLAMLGVAAIVLAWLLVIRPLGDPLSEAKERQSAAVLGLADVRAQVAAIERASNAAPASLGAPVDVVLSQSAVEAGFPANRIERNGVNQATLFVEAVRPQAFFGWVAQMEGRGLVVDRMSATANADQTLAVQVSFRARGA